MKQRNKQEKSYNRGDVFDSPSEEEVIKSEKIRVMKFAAKVIVVSSAVAYFTEPQFCDAAKVGFGVAAAGGVGLTTLIGLKLGEETGMIFGSPIGSMVGGLIGKIISDNKKSGEINGYIIGDNIGEKAFVIGGWVAGVLIGYNVSHTHLKDWMKERNEKHRTEKVREIKQTSMNILSAPLLPKTVNYNDARAALKM